MRKILVAAVAALGATAALAERPVLLDEYVAFSVDSRMEYLMLSTLPCADPTAAKNGWGKAVFTSAKHRPIFACYTYTPDREAYVVCPEKAAGGLLDTCTREPKSTFKSMDKLDEVEPPKPSARERKG